MNAERLYRSVADEIGRLIRDGTFRPGDRIPSVRELSRHLRISVTTVVDAYHLLEEQELVEARARLGYVVRARSEPLAPLPEPPPDERPLVVRFFQDSRDARLTQLGSAAPNVELLPALALARALRSVARDVPSQLVSYDVTPGPHALRAQIAQRAIKAGCTVSADDVMTTCGAQEAIYLAHAAICRAGDLVAVESPVSCGVLEVLDRLRLRALPVPADPDGGIRLDALRAVLEREPVRAVTLASNFSNPLGGSLSVSRKRWLVAMLAERDVPLIEDDSTGDLSHDGERPMVAKAFDRKGLVLLCSSFSRTLAPGFRVGWMVPGRFFHDVERLKASLNIASPTLSQVAVSRFLRDGEYDRHLKRITQVYADQCRDLADAVINWFPPGTQVTRPRGGFFLWVELPPGKSALTLYDRAVARGLTIAPGPLFSTSRGHEHCFRLSAARWSPEIERAVATLGRLAAE